MTEINLSKNEILIIVDLLERASNIFSNHSCDDYHLVDDAGLEEFEWKLLNRKVMGWSGEEDDEDLEEELNSPWQQDHMLMDYFADVLKKVAEGKIEHKSIREEAGEKSVFENIRKERDSYKNKYEEVRKESKERLYVLNALYELLKQAMMLTVDCPAKEDLARRIRLTEQGEWICANCGQDKDNCHCGGRR